MDYLSELMTPFNVAMIVVMGVMVHKMLRPAVDYSKVEVLDKKDDEEAEFAPRDYTLDELRQFNGVDNPHILIALKGNIYNVTSGRRFYGPRGPYGLFGGRDASRALAKSDLSGDSLPTTWDTLDDLNMDEQETLDHWAESYNSKYPIVGKLVASHEGTANEDTPTGATGEKENSASGAVEKDVECVGEEKKAPDTTATPIQPAGEGQGNRSHCEQAMTAEEAAKHSALLQATGTTVPESEETKKAASSELEVSTGPELPAKAGDSTQSSATSPETSEESQLGPQVDPTRPSLDQSGSEWQYLSTSDVGASFSEHDNKPMP